MTFSTVHRSVRLRPIVALAGGCCLALALAACSSTPSGGGATTSSSPGGAASSTGGGASGSTGGSGGSGNSGSSTTAPSGGGGSTPTVAQTISSAFSSPTDRTDAAGTVWLCRPGLANDPCGGNLDTEVLTASGTSTTSDYGVGGGTAEKKADCFYVYPTVSSEPSQNSNLKVQASEIATAQQQAAQFSRVCNVWAPMYRQVTVTGLFHATGSAAAHFTLAFHSVLATFEDYLHHDNHGRPIVLIGHSQGAAMVIKILETTMDNDPALRKQLVSAVILGGNVQVPTGKLVGGSFAHIPLCTTVSETGCVIAYSSFLQTPPADSLFGKAGTGVSALSGQTDSTGMQVACTNPAALGGGTGADQPIFHGGATNGDPFVSYPGLYTSTCEHANDLTWLGVHIISTPGDTRPKVTESLGPNWGLHLYDVNIDLGGLVADVGHQITAWHG